MTDSEGFKSIISFMFWRYGMRISLTRYPSICEANMQKTDSSPRFLPLTICITLGKTLNLLKNIQCWWVFTESWWCVVGIMLWHYLNILIRLLVLPWCEGCFGYNTEIMRWTGKKLFANFYLFIFFAYLETDKMCRLQKKYVKKVGSASKKHGE